MQRKLTHLFTQLVTSLLLLPVFSAGAKETAYFPPHNAEWASLEDVSDIWDKEKLKELISYTGSQKSSGLLIVQDGKIVSETYWPEKNYTDRTPRFQRVVQGKDAYGSNVEDVASVQKSIASLIVGIAQEKGFLSIKDPVTKYLGKGWSRATPEQEAKITVRHLITMTSGLMDDLTYEADAGTRWRYNTTAYGHSMHVAAKASGMSPQDMVAKWLTQPLGLTDTEWGFRPGLEHADIKDQNVFGLSTTNRDLARIGLMVLNGGKWEDQTIIPDIKYLHDATHPSQEVNPSYGYLWWLNGQKTVRNGDGSQARKGPLIPEAPKDLFAAQGALGRKLYIVPSMNLVITRLGNQPPDRDFNDEFWKRLMAAAPR